MLQLSCLSEILTGKYYPADVQGDPHWPSSILEARALRLWPPQQPNRLHLELPVPHQCLPPMVQTDKFEVIKMQELDMVSEFLPMQLPGLERSDNNRASSSWDFDEGLKPL